MGTVRLEREEAMTAHRTYHSSLGMLSFLLAGSMLTVITDVTQRSLLDVRYNLVVVGMAMLLTTLLLGKGRQSQTLVWRGIVAALGWSAVGFLFVSPLIGLASQRYVLRIIVYTIAYGSTFALLAYGTSQLVRFSLLGACFGAGVSWFYYACLAHDPNILRGILQLNPVQLEVVLTYMACGGTVGLGMSFTQDVTKAQKGRRTAQSG